MYISPSGSEFGRAYQALGVCTLHGFSSLDLRAKFVMMLSSERGTEVLSYRRIDGFALENFLSCFGAFFSYAVGYTTNSSKNYVDSTQLSGLSSGVAVAESFSCRTASKGGTNQTRFFL